MLSQRCATAMDGESGVLRMNDELFRLNVSHRDRT